MGKCSIEISGSPPESLYESKTDGKGHFVEDIYRNRESFNYYWAKMSDNISNRLQQLQKFFLRRFCLPCSKLDKIVLRTIITIVQRAYS